MESRDRQCVYIGEASQRLETRIEKQVNAWDRDTMCLSIFAHHLISNSHDFDKRTVSLIHHENSSIFYRSIASSIHLEVLGQ